jgi:two-component system cell cycle sensor histidine kinase/response regulator CckA
VFNLFVQNVLNSFFSFPPEYLPAALLVSLLSVWVLVGLFSYLNFYTRRRYFTIWTVAWLFYALWLTFPLSLHQETKNAFLEIESPLVQMLRQWSVSVAAVFLLWGTVTFLKLKTSQRLFGLFLCFLMVWSYVGVYHLESPLQAQLPIFGLIGLASVLAAFSFFQLRRRNPKYLGAGLLAVGFFCWGLYLVSYPFFKSSGQLISCGFFISAVLQLFIAVSMIVLVLEEAQISRELAEQQARVHKSEKEVYQNQMVLAEERYRSLFDQANEAIFIASAEDLRLLKVNPMGERLLGLQSATDPLPNLAQFFAPEAAPPAGNGSTAEWVAWLGSQADFNLCRQDGSSIPADGKGAPIRFEGQVAYQFVFRDLTEQKKLEAQFLRAQRMESIGNLASGLAHDLNNVLGPNLMSVQLLREKTTEPKSQSLLASIETSTRRGIGIIRQLLTFGRGLEGKRVRLNPRALVEDLLRMAQETFPKSIEVTATYSRHLWPVLGDVTQLQQVLLNLCLNARDAMPQGGKLKIKVSEVQIDEQFSRMNLEAKVGPYVIISVADTGCGIAPTIIYRIFDPFFSTKEPGKGTGLGLSTALGIVKSHGGFFQVLSELGHGAEFKVFLPAVTDADTEPETTALLVPTRGQGELIMVVEDEAALRPVIKQTLEDNGYRVLTANDGTEAIPLYRQNRTEIRAVLTDLLMPGMDGMATIRALIALNPQVVIVAMSGLMVDPPELQAMGKNVRAFLAKPFTSPELLTTFKEVLTLAQAEGLAAEAPTDLAHT